MTAAVPAEALAYLGVDRFLQSAIDARSLKTALEIGLIDRLMASEGAALDALARALRCDRAGLRLLLDLLRAADVVGDHDGSYALTAAFRAALPFRDLLEARLEFAGLVAPDFFDLLTPLIAEPARFRREARLFGLFDYARCLHPSPENRAATGRWVRLTTALTRYEAPVCLALYDFGRHRHVLDVGGNSGEFVRQLCRAHPQLRATVADLPVVCDLGEEHVRDGPEAARIAFVRGNALEAPLPADVDLVTFKSMLHDWPEPAVAGFLARAFDALPPGGGLLIFERGPLEIGTAPVPYGLLPILLFFRSYRSPSVYEAMLQQIGFEASEIRRVELETPFFLVTARKPG